MNLDDVYGSAKPKVPLTVDWQDTEQIAKDEQAGHILDEL